MFSFVQGKRNAATSGTSVTVTLTAAPTQGNLLVVCLRDNVATDTYTLAGYLKAGQVLATNASSVFWYKIAGAGESATIAPSPGGPSTFEIVAMEFSTDFGTPKFLEYSGVAGIGSARTSIAAPDLSSVEAAYLAVMMAATSSNAITSPAIDSGFSVFDGPTVVYAVTGYKAGTASGLLVPTASWVTGATATASMAVFASEPDSRLLRPNVMRPGMFKPGIAR